MICWYDYLTSCSILCFIYNCLCLWCCKRPRCIFCNASELGASSAKYYVALVFLYIFGFLTGLCTWGIQGVMLNLPHEYADRDPKTIGWMFSLIWGFGYIFYTIIFIIISVVPMSTSISKPTASINSNNYNCCNNTNCSWWRCYA